MMVSYGAGGHPMIGKGRNNELQVDRSCHAAQQAGEQGVMTAFKAGKAHLLLLPQTIGKVHGHAVIKNPHLRQIRFQTILIAETSVEGRALLNALQGHEIIHQPDIRYKIST